MLLESGFVDLGAFVLYVFGFADMGAFVLGALGLWLRGRFRARCPLAGLLAGPGLVALSPAYGLALDCVCVCVCVLTAV